MSIKRLLAFPLLTIILLAACNPASPAQTPTPSPSSAVLSDCFYSATALAFLDANENGVRDEGEAPLEGIEFVLDPTVYSRTTSGPDGIADIFATTPNAGTNISCDQFTAEHPLQISAVSFDGYQLTTSQSLPYIDASTQYPFGFKSTQSTQSTQSTPPGAEPASTGSASDVTPGAEPASTGSASDVTPETVTEPVEVVEGDNGYELSPDWSVAQVNYLFEWYGEALPVFEYEQFTAAGGQYLRADEGDFSSQIQALLTAVNSLTPADSVQYTNLWTDDYPQWTIELVGQDGRSVLLYSESTGFRGHAPWYVAIGDQLYRQTNGDIGYAVYDLASDYARDYFSLDEQPFDESFLEPPGRPYIYRTYHNFTGLLPIAKSFEYDYAGGSLALTGLFYWDEQEPDYDHSSQHITGVEAIQLTLPDGQIQPCTFEGNPDPEHPAFTLWTFRCPYTSNEEQSVTIQITFTTNSDRPLTISGQLNPLGFVLPNGIPPTD